MKRSLLFWGLLVVALIALPPVVLALKQPFYLDLVRRIMILAIAAVSLNLILGYGGMVSFGHAAYLGIGAYAVGILGFYGITSGGSTSRMRTPTVQPAMRPFMRRAPQRVPAGGT